MSLTSKRWARTTQCTEPVRHPRAGPSSPSRTFFLPVPNNLQLLCLPSTSQISTTIKTRPPPSRTLHPYPTMIFTEAQPVRLRIDLRLLWSLSMPNRRYRPSHLEGAVEDEERWLRWSKQPLHDGAARLRMVALVPAARRLHLLLASHIPALGAEAATEKAASQPPRRRQRPQPNEPRRERRAKSQSGSLENSFSFCPSRYALQAA
jgi:hypothetical protein